MVLSPEERRQRGCEANRKWRQANREHVNAYQRRYREEHADFAARSRAYSRAWRDANRGQARHNSNRWAARERARSWFEQGRSYRDYEDYCRNCGAPVPMSEENYAMTMEFLTELRQAPKVIDVWRDGCISVPMTQKVMHPVREPVPVGGACSGRWQESFRSVRGWVPPIHLLAGWLRSLLVPAGIAREPESRADWDAIEYLAGAGLVDYLHGAPSATDHGKAFLDACGGMTPRGLIVDFAALPAEVFRYRSGECPFVEREFRNTHNQIVRVN